MHYSQNPGHVRCEQFKTNGKWYQTLELDMHQYYWGGGERCPKGARFYLLHEAVALALFDKKGYDAESARTENEGWVYTVLDPYHENGFPQHFTTAQALKHVNEWTEGNRLGRRTKK